MTARTQALDMLRGVARKDADGRILHQFATDPGRIDRLEVEAAGLYLDLSKQSWSPEGFEAARDLARRPALVRPDGALEKRWLAPRVKRPPPAPASTPPAATTPPEPEPEPADPNEPPGLLESGAPPP